LFINNEVHRETLT